jgi:hypothetical protein
MTVKDKALFWEGPAFGAVRKAYLRPGSRTYERNYGTNEDNDNRRRVLLPKDFLDEVSLPSEYSDLSHVLSASLGLFRIPKSKLAFIEVEEMNRVIEDTEELKEYARKRGFEFCESLSTITPDNFRKAYDNLMIFWDLMLGARYKAVHSHPGLASYYYDEDTYPFEEDSPSEALVWSWGQGAASYLHTVPEDEKPKEMRAIIEHMENLVKVLSRERSDFNKEELALTL